MSASLKALELKSERKLFSLQDFREADVVDRLYIHLMMGEHPSYRLTDRERERYEWLEVAYSLQREERARWPALQKLRKLLREDKMARKWSAVLLMDQSEKLFSRFEKTHRPTQRGIIRENLNHRIRFCEEQLETCEDKEAPLWEKLIAGYWKQLADLDQVSVIEEAGERDNTLSIIEITSDPAALSAALDKEAEDAEIVK